MMSLSNKENVKSLKEICHVNTNNDGDRFVGVKVDTDGAQVCFPIGYNLPDTDKALRTDIRHLIHILAEFTSKEERVLANSSNKEKQTVDYPINAYLGVLDYFFSNGGRYYVETENKYITATTGKQNWAKTIKHHKPLLQENNGNYSLIFTKFIVRTNSPNSNKLITQINRFCVYEAFQRIGWLYVSYEPEKPGPHPDIRTSIAILQNKLANTNDDRKRALFTNMKSMLEFMDNKTTSKQFYFGTETFEHVWEKLIDIAFGENNKEDYYPHSRWTLRYGNERENHPLMPDSIMVYGNKCYILDAKYYKYGVTGNPYHLPEGSSILKQIAYGDYVRQKQIFSNIFNAFIMPFNKENHIFGDSKDNLINVGEATGDWRGESNKEYERIQGIVMDTRFMLYHYTGKLLEERKNLIKCIEEGLAQPPTVERKSDLDKFNKISENGKAVILAGSENEVK